MNSIARSRLIKPLVGNPALWSLGVFLLLAAGIVGASIPLVIASGLLGFGRPLLYAAALNGETIEEVTPAVGKPTRLPFEQRATNRVGVLSAS